MLVWSERQVKVYEQHSFGSAQQEALQVVLFAPAQSRWADADRNAPLFKGGEGRCRNHRSRRFTTGQQQRRATRTLSHVITRIGAQQKCKRFWTKVATADQHPCLTAHAAIFLVASGLLCDAKVSSHVLMQPLETGIQQPLFFGLGRTCRNQRQQSLTPGRAAESRTRFS